ncbi:tyrosine-type recombinase/integrase [Sinorhizobium meliloti]|uniref:tyrosine-type recombinase/integrase n=1 Tax=Rhizobium meliloti TaxID=382 RepID=UPI000B5FC0C1|nr:tyrosine-type recombinase/integrase [Sinorhizobium meliloti]ASJ60579.1 hypothetical protein SMB554_16105 [Sinorhizobium meliloti]MCK3781793.1 tyrosine-type recombinase/integrase [Sinorhizobium meliloti]MCK3789580.1 tyrosine-type recombinase/integrase [Sinorhizobium meliloti]MCK3796523.1 tyrosine-type recombinase/integrase [Sinorhizobium meliloti]UTG97453.1 tyrosine-type recombinase/integrase [Sinorhizobium meliloti]
MQKIKFTDQIIEGLPFAPPGEHHQFADETVNNMRVLVGGGYKAFYYIATSKTGRHLWQLGWFPGMKTQDAREMAIRLDQTTNAVQPATDRDTDPHGSTFAEVAEAYVAWLPFRPRNTSVAAETKFFRRYIQNPSVNSCLSKKMKDVTDQDIAEIVEGIRRRGAPTTARNCLVKLGTMFRWSMRPERRRQFGLEVNEMAFLSPRTLGFAKQRARTRRLSSRELQAYLTVIEQLASASDRAIAKALAFTGRRLSELTMIRWQDVDLDRHRFWHHDERSIAKPIPISDAMAALLAALRTYGPEPDGFVFGAGGDRKGPRNRSRLKAEIDRRMAEWLVVNGGEPPKHWRWQDLRRTVHALLVELGVDWVTAMSAIGSGSREVSNDRGVRKALELLARELDAIRRGAGRSDLLD